MLHLLVSLFLLTPDAGPAPQATQAPPTAPAAQPQRPAPPPPYNPTADVKAQIAAALKSAKDDGIRVLVNFGSNDDESSKAFAVARGSRGLSTFFGSEYKVVNVDVGQANKNLDVAQAYGVTMSATTLPALAVLDADGKVLARTSGTAFRSDADPAVHDPAKLAAFLTKHQAPPAPDAEPVLQAALKQAKADGKSLIVWFSAPW
jgi:hypothetical protein